MESLQQKRPLTIAPPRDIAQPRQPGPHVRDDRPVANYPKTWPFCDPVLRE